MAGEESGGPGGRRARGELESAVLAALWAADGPSAPGDVQRQIPGAAYTTVVTVLTRLCEKGLVTRRRAGRAYHYRPVDDRAGVTAAGMRALLDDGGDRARVLARFVSELSPEDEQLLEELLRHDDG